MQNYSTVQADNPKELPSLMNDGERLNGRLREIAQRVEKVADTLHGSTPRDAGAKPGAPIANSLRRNIDVGNDIVSDIETELNRIEQRL